jgi:predicted TIM-barrel fold metal-dependent hydrolase
MSITAKQQMIDEVLSGRPVSSFNILDCHGHMGYWHNFNIPARTAADMVCLMDRSGIQSIVAAGHAGIGPDFRRGNDEVIAGMKQFPKRIYGYCCVNPHYSPQEMRDELNRCFDSGMIAVKLHPAMHGYPVNGDRYIPAWEFANKHGCCVLSHTGVSDANCNIGLFEKLAQDFPNAKIILGHSGFGYEGAQLSIELALKYSNVYLDITASTFYTGLVERMVKGAGPDRVLFGTDLPFMDCRGQVGRMAFSTLEDRELRLVLGENARRLFGIQ